MSLDRSGVLVPTDDAGDLISGDVATSAWVTLLLDRIDSAGGFTSVLAPTTTGTQNAWAPGILGDTFINWAGASALTLNGIADIASSRAGQRIVIRNTGSQVLTLNHDSGSAATGEKIFTDGIAVAIGGGGAVELVRNGDSGSGHWIVTNWTQGAPISYTPTLGGVTLGNGTVTATYIRSGKRVDWQLVLTLGSTSALAAGPITVSLPLTASSTTSPASNTTGDAIDAGGPAYYAVRAIPNSTTAISLTTNGSPVSGIGTTTPFTWINPDVLAVGGWYFAA